MFKVRVDDFCNLRGIYIYIFSEYWQLFFNVKVD